MEDLATLLARATEALNAFGDSLPTITLVLGVFLVGRGLIALRTNAHIGFGLTTVILGMLCVGFAAFTDALSLSFFGEEGAFSPPKAQDNILSPYITFALTLVILVGALSILKGLLCLKRVGAGEDEALAPALSHLIAGVFCVNIVAFTKAVGSTLGGSLQTLINTLLP